MGEELDKPSVLVADDSPDLAAVLGYLFRSWGYRTLVVHDGLAAWDVIVRERPAFVFLDVEMPLLRGDEVVRRVRDRPELKHTVVVTLSGDPEVREWALKAGATCHLLKPVDTAELRVIFGR